MSRRATAFGIKAEAVNAFLALADSLQRLTDDGRKPVCHARPEQWTGDATPTARQDAAEACTFCPVQPACLAYALAQNEPQGVWGGRDFTPTTRRRKDNAA